MKFMTVLILLITNCFVTQISSGQDSASIKIIQLSGYLKDINTFKLPVRNQSLFYENIIHNRINIDLQTNQWKSNAAIRNRYFFSEKKMISSLERLWIEYRTEKWSMTAGKQRINWGMNNNWNPNDIFNTYNLLDFDFEERSGINGLKIHRRLSSKSAIELGYKSGWKKDKTITAIKYNFHAGIYDWQLNAGSYSNRLTIGIGWQGGIGSSGFKGEFQFFHKKDESKTFFNGSIELDYINNNGWYSSVSILYCHSGITEPPGNLTDFNFNTTSDQIMPTRWNSLISIRKEISPILNMSLNILYSPSAGIWIIYPTGTYHLMNDFNVDLIWQGFWAERNKGLYTIQHNGFIRFKLSF